MKTYWFYMVLLFILVGWGRDFPVAHPGDSIQQAIDAAAAAGGGRVVVGAGAHVTGSLILKSHVELHLAAGAVLLGGTNVTDYIDFPKSVCSVSPESSYKVLLQAWDAEDIAITGAGTIDGRGPSFFPVKPARGHWPNPHTRRPIMVQFLRCRNVRLEGVTFKDSPLWTMFIRLCENITVNNITVDGDQRMINNDGIDFDSCRHVRVTNSKFRTGDDCLILRAMRERREDHVVCEDFVVSNCVLKSTCQAIRIGAPSDDTIRNATFLDIRAEGYNGVFFDYPAVYLRPYDEGFVDVSNIVFDGFSGNFYGSPFQIVVEPGLKLRGVRNVICRNFNVTGRDLLRFVGNADSPLVNIELEHIRAQIHRRNPAHAAIATEPIVFKDCVLNGRKWPDRPYMTPRPPRQPLRRVNGVSWENLDQSAK